MKPAIAAKLAKIFGIISVCWVVFAVALIIVSIIGLLLSEPSLYHGWKRVSEIFNPYNIANSVAIIVLFLPAVGAVKLQELFDRKAKVDSTESDS